MTLGELIDAVGDNPLPAAGYFLTVPLTAVVAGWLGRGEGAQTPWKYLYTVIVYAVCIPGIFALALGVYQFMFGRRDILNADGPGQLSGKYNANFRNTARSRTRGFPGGHPKK